MVRLGGLGFLFSIMFRRTTMVRSRSLAQIQSLNYQEHLAQDLNNKLAAHKHVQVNNTFNININIT